MKRIFIIGYATLLFATFVHGQEGTPEVPPVEPQVPAERVGPEASTFADLQDVRLVGEARCRGLREDIAHERHVIRRAIANRDNSSMRLAEKRQV